MKYFKEWFCVTIKFVTIASVNTRLYSFLCGAGVRAADVIGALQSSYVIIAIPCYWSPHDCSNRIDGQTVFASWSPLVSLGK